MDVIKRNFFALLKAGAFGETHSVEPMSAHKWRKLFAVMGVHEVVPYAWAGYNKQQLPFVQHVPKNIIHDLRNCQHAASTHKYESAQLSNGLLNKRLNNIRNNEPHAIDTSTETVHVLNIIVHNIETMLNKGVVLRGIVDLGIYLRTMGHKIDFIKLENWLTKLHVETLAQFQGSILIQLLGFDTDEVPFTGRVMTDAKNVTLKAVERTVKDTSYKWDFKQNKSPWVQVNSQAIKQSMCRSFHYLLYAPIETISNLTYKFAKNLSELEE